MKKDKISPPDDKVPAAVQIAAGPPTGTKGLFDGPIYAFIRQMLEGRITNVGLSFSDNSRTVISINGRSVREVGKETDDGSAS